MNFQAPSGPHARNVTYLEHKNFRRSLADLRAMGGQPGRRAEKARAVFGGIQLGEANPFRGLPLTNHGETRIQGCIKYDLGDGFRLITVQTDGLVLLCFVGNHADCDSWLSANSGLRVSADKQNQWKPVFRSGQAHEEHIRRDAGPTRGRVIERLHQDKQGEMLSGVQPRLIAGLYAIDETSTDGDIGSITGQIGDTERRVLIYDVMCLLLAGDVAAAENRLDLAAGRIREADDLSEDDWLEIHDSDTIRRVPIGSTEHQELLDRLSSSLPYYDWQLFMHPEQQAVVDAEFGGSAQLSGVSGAGKTCVAVRRAARLASTNPSARILLLTLNRSLATLINQLVSHVAPELASRIRVTSFFELCQELLADLEPQSNRLYSDVSWKLEEHIDEVFREFYRCWHHNHDAAVLLPVHRSLTARGVSSETYLREEFDWIRSAITGTRSPYLDMDRLGRRFPMPGEWRGFILEGLAGWERKMTAVGVIDYVGLTTAVSRHIEDLTACFDHALVDEAQDFGTTELAIVRKLVKAGPNDIFLCGDVAQHVLPKHRVLAQAGIDVSGRTRRIMRNYRNSREILSAAYDVLIENLDEAMLDSSDLELLDPELANRSSPKPGVLEASDLSSEIIYARSLVADHLEDRPNDHCCIAVAGYTMREVDLFAKTLQLAVLDGTGEPNSSALVLSDLEQTKGYEFDLMVIVNCTDGVLPPRDAPAEEAFRHGCKLYVAMTRAKDELYLSYSGKPSPWLTSVEGRLNFMSWSDVVNRRSDMIPTQPDHLEETEDQANNQGIGLLDGISFTRTTAALGLSVEAQERLAELVDGRGMSRGGRSVRWRTVSDLARDLDSSPTARQAFGRSTYVEVRGALKRTLDR